MNARSATASWSTNSIEVDEATYPILIEERSVAEDSMGFGRWNGAPAVKGSYRSLTGDMTVYFCGDGGTFPAKGVLGGKPGAGCGTWKRHRNGKLERLPDFHTEHGRADARRCITAPAPVAAMAIRASAIRPRVLADVNRRWLSVAAARKVFGVAVTNPAPNGVDYVLDETGTARLRKTQTPKTQSEQARIARRKRDTSKAEETGTIE